MKLKTAFSLLVATMAIDSRFDVVASSSSILDGSDPQATRKTRVLKPKNANSCQTENDEIIALKEEIETLKPSPNFGGNGLTTSKTLWSQVIYDHFIPWGVCAPSVERSTYLQSGNLADMKQYCEELSWCDAIVGKYDSSKGGVDVETEQYLSPMYPMKCSSGIGKSDGYFFLYKKAPPDPSIEEKCNTIAAEWCSGYGTGTVYADCYAIYKYDPTKDPKCPYLP